MRPKLLTILLLRSSLTLAASARPGAEPPVPHASQGQPPSGGSLPCTSKQTTSRVHPALSRKPHASTPRSNPKFELQHHGGPSAKLQLKMSCAW
jgi:hypothetical protein